MKLLILITISIISLNVFSAEVGEDQKGECQFANQSSKRDAKPAEVSESEASKEGSKAISK